MANPLDPNDQGDKVLLESAAAGVAIYEYLSWQQYKAAVGVKNTSLRDWRVWKDQQKQLRKAQPRRSVLLGWASLVFAAITLHLYYRTTSTGDWGLLWVGGIIVALVGFSHKRPPAAAIQAINDWHRTRGQPSNGKPHVAALGPNATWQDKQRYNSKANKEWRKSQGIPSDDEPLF